MMPLTDSSSYIESIDGLPIIGNQYLVNVAATTWAVPHEYPILLPAHSDPKYFPHVPRHFHYDLRFFSDADIHRLVGTRVSWKSGQPNGWTSADHALYAATSFIRPDDHMVIGLKVMPCIRQMPVFPTDFIFANGSKDTNWPLRQMEMDYEGASVKPDCQRCPHRGISLKGLPRDENNRVTCPGHGLRWDLSTGKLSPRVTGPQPDGGVQ